MRLAKVGASLVQGTGALAAGCHAAERIEAGAHIDRMRDRCSALFTSAAKCRDDVAGLRAEIEVDGDAGIEEDAVQHTREASRPIRRGHSHWR